MSDGTQGAYEPPSVEQIDAQDSPAVAAAGLSDND